MLFGGLNSAGTDFSDTWTWNGVAKTWIQLFPASSPSPRRPMMAYDAPTKSVVLLGGDDGSAHYNDTWLWGGKTWTQQFPTSAPPARGLACMAYDSNLGSVVLFGGGVAPSALFDDTWAWKGGNWTEIYPSNIPPYRYAAGMDYNPLAKGVMIFGGFSSGPSLNDTWLLTEVP